VKYSARSTEYICNNNICSSEDHYTTYIYGNPGSLHEDSPNSTLQRCNTSIPLALHHSWTPLLFFFSLPTPWNCKSTSVLVTAQSLLGCKSI
jgi:hypothetical protein